MHESRLYCYVQKPHEFLLEKSTYASEVVSDAIYSEEVRVLEERGDWVRVQMNVDQYCGWVRKEALARCPQLFFDGVTAKVQRLSLPLYPTPSIRFVPLTVLPFGSRLKVLEEHDELWLKIVLFDGRTAFVRKSGVSTDPKVLSRQEMMDLSKKFLGVPYLWGGRSSFGLDCSGFVQLLYREMGIYLPRDARDQVKWEEGASIPLEELEPGDLIFFGPEKDRITHVGMSLGGREFIQATAREGMEYVRISSLDEGEWNGSRDLKFCTARRLTQVAENAIRR